MKKLVRILLVSLVLLLAVPVYAKADPQGYKIVKITKKNVKKYFSLKLTKGKLGEYNLWLHSKLRKKGYYLIGGRFVMAGTFKEGGGKYITTKEKFRIEAYKYATGCCFDNPVVTYSYKTRITNVKFKKATGYVIFAEPSNISRIEGETSPWGGLMYSIYLRYPFPQEYDAYDDTKYSFVSGEPYIIRDRWDFRNNSIY